MKNLRNPFTVNDVELARACASAPGDYALTEPELRACHAVIAWADDSASIEEDDARLAKQLLDVLRRGWVR